MLRAICGAANGVVQGQAQEEKLIVAIKAVAQLLNACQVKADGTTGDYRYILTTQSCTVHVRMSGKRNIHV